MSRLDEASVRGVVLCIAEDLVGSLFVGRSRAPKSFDVTWEDGELSPSACLKKDGVILEATGRNDARVFDDRWRSSRSSVVELTERNLGIAECEWT